MNGTSSAEEHLQECLSRAEAAAGLRYAEGVRDAIAADRRDAFRRNEGRWPTHGHMVLRAADFTGRFARLFADFDEQPKIREKDMREALKVVKKICDARLMEGGMTEDDAARVEWCS